MLLRLRATRGRAGPERGLVIEHRAMPLELERRVPIPRRVVDTGIPLWASLTPDFGWTAWQGRAEEYPVTVLPALEAVRAAGARSILAGEQRDLALRRAFFVRCRCISMRHEILAIAATCPDLDVGALSDDLDRGTFQAAGSQDFADAKQRRPVQRHPRPARRAHDVQPRYPDRLDRRHHAARRPGPDCQRPSRVRPNRRRRHGTRTRPERVTGSVKGPSTGMTGKGPFARDGP